ncbi:MAG TPA: phospholipase D family protein [Candidatus Dormibacteraeota bacterium]|nr:phospholipase D family protein [Candidatus Dormibacteraeota bacterium]
MDKVTDVISRFDAAIGSTIERATVSHHRRRLARVGWDAALRARPEAWARGEPGPRPGNRVDVLIDGDQALPAIAAEIRQARSHINVTGWHLNPTFALDQESPPGILRELLVEATRTVRVRVLLWAGAPLPIFRPARKDMKKVREALCDGNGIECALDARERPMHCHHDKTIVVDDRVAFVGGIDLTDLGGNRLDASAHASRPGIGWHDASVRIEGPCVHDVADHFRLRWNATTGQQLPSPPLPVAAGDTPLQVVRTVPDGMYRELPRGDFRILESYVGALSAAQRFIYLENQFLWSPEILTVLREKLRHPPNDDFRLVILLPAKPNSGADDTRGQLSTLAEADGDRGRLLACTLVSPDGATGRAVYVHAKIGIVDDTWLTLGSANLNEHSLFNDTEMNVVIRDQGLVRDTRERLWA